MKTYPISQEIKKLKPCPHCGRGPKPFRGTDTIVFCINPHCTLTGIYPIPVWESLPRKGDAISIKRIGFSN